ncbi:hypothetical protein K469DRAFT_350551 [Zopfia rhizophila CBS 207.26]|uniref:DUF7708 domain-containing protein n=1 Tax=Zopfia rhizophila CBS 207.26 TaxID=1314779 RepID=A0A6A6DJZ7_9PEZI|nr:hypothetical protein K469DRAFT_350551 [Zopfia rhizophila CBS 207.26]
MSWPLRIEHKTISMANSNAPGTDGLGDSVFIEARDQFLNSLLPSERAQFAKCHSAQQLLKDIKNLLSLKKNAAVRRSCVQSIANLGTKLSPYFDAIGWIVQSHPEFAAIGWGAFRFVLQLASNYTSFFEKLLRTLHRLAVEFPTYKLLAKHQDEAPTEPMSAAIYHGISALYASLLRFLHHVVRVFRKKDGTPKRTLRVAASISWKPFDLWFGDLKILTCIVEW